MSERIFIPTPEAMAEFGGKLAKESKRGDLIFLEGTLGAGKTTLIRGFLRALGVQGAIKSPSFALIEPYETNELAIFHFDLYRIKSPKELLDLGLSDYLTDDAICLIEWPEKGKGILPKPNKYCTIEIPKQSQGRWVTLVCN